MLIFLKCWYQPPSFRYLATLYTHPDYPNEPKVSHKIKPEIRKCVEKYWQVHLSPPWSSKYLRKIITKGMNGQPVSFTDFYGYLVGQQLLKGVSLCFHTIVFKTIHIIAIIFWKKGIKITILVKMRKDFSCGCFS